MLLEPLNEPVMACRLPQNRFSNNLIKASDWLILDQNYATRFETSKILIAIVLNEVYLHKNKQALAATEAMV